MPRLEYRIERMQLMVLHGLNVPDYVENPSQQFDTHAIAVLTRRFEGVEQFRHLSNAPGEGVETDAIWKRLSTAHLACAEVERKGHTAWLMVDDICCEYEGTIRVDRRGVGKMKWTESFLVFKEEFQNFENIPNIRHKIIVRRVFKFLMENVWMDAVAMDFGWAKDFCGSLSERMVFFDFMPLKNIS